MPPSFGFDLIFDERESPSDERDSPKNTQAAMVARDPSFEMFDESNNPFRERFVTKPPLLTPLPISETKAVIQKYRLKSVPHPRIDAHDDEEAPVFSQGMAVCIKTNVNEYQQPATPSTLQLSFGGSQSELGSLNTVPRRPGGILSSINFRHQSDLDMSFARMDLTLKSDLTPPVDDSSKQPELSLLEQAVTSRYEEKNRRNNHPKRSRSQYVIQQRMRNRRRSIPSDTQRRALMCGPVHEIRESIQDVTYSVQQIIRSIRQFGPKERDAVMETLHEAGYFIRQKCKPVKVCGPLGCSATSSFDYEDDDIGHALDDTKSRSIVTSDSKNSNLINLVGSEISLTNNIVDSKTTIYGTRSSSDLTDMNYSEISSVVYKMPVDNIFRSRRPGRSHAF